MKITYLIPEPSSEGGMTAITKMFYQINLFDKKENFHFCTSFTWGKSKILRFFESFVLQFSFIIHLIKVKPDVIFVMSNSYFGFYDKCIYCLIARAFSVKTMLNHVGGEFDKFYNSGSYNRWLIHQFIKFPHALLIGSSYWINYFSSHFPNVKVYNSPNPIISKDYQNVKDDVKNKFIVSSLFRLVKEKGIEELISVIRGVTKTSNDIEFVIMGGGPLLQYLKDELNEQVKNKQVRILGFISDETKIIEICRSNLYVMLTHFDVMPISVLEAMAAGNSVISTRVGGIPDLVMEGQNGFLVDVGETNIVIEKIKLLAGDRKLNYEMGEFSKQIILNKYDIMSVISTHRKIANELLNDSGN